MMQRDEFLRLDSAEIARLVQENDTRVCVFPSNGTRRWYLLEHATDGQGYEHYLEVMTRRQAELYALLFEHGIEIILAPMFGPDLLARGDAYMQMASEGMLGLTKHAALCDLYETYDVRVRFYGDYHQYFVNTPYAYLSNTFDELMQQTASHSRHRIFYGVFANDATETVARLSVEYFKAHGTIPDKSTLVRLYYGEPVPPVSLFIGFGKFAAFDMPLVATGDEDLYFTVSPSPYLNQPQVRVILHDHLFARREQETDYSEISSEDWAAMRAFYRANATNTLGVGTQQPRAGYWYPLPQLALPEEEL